MESTGAKLQAVIDQKSIPLLIRRSKKPLRIRLPYRTDNRQWIQNERKNVPKWIKEHVLWEVPNTWFNDLVERTLKKFGKLYIIQPYRVQEKCAPACMYAVGHECQCSCMGANHGMGNDGTWFEVSDTFATRWGEREIACRLMTLP